MPLSIRSSTCERSFFTMRKNNTYLRSMFQNRFSDLGMTNIKRNIVTNVENIKNYFSKTKRRIKLI